MTPPYWHDLEWRALLLSVVAEPDDAVRRMRCTDWLQERGEVDAAKRWDDAQVPTTWNCTSDEWYQSWPAKQCDLCLRDGYDPACVRCVQDGERVYPCKELAWTLPIRDVVLVGDPCTAEHVSNRGLWYYSTRSELALRFARS